MTGRVRSVGQVALGLLVGYLLLLALVWWRQDDLLYLPERLSPEAAAVRSRESGLQALRGDALLGYLREPAGTARATVVVFHGNAGNALDRDYYADALVRLGVRVVLAEYPGYGEKAGAPGEAALRADAEATLTEVRRRFGGPLIAWGESLGAGVVGAALARRPELADGAVLLTPWDTLAAVAARHYGWLPVRLMLRDRYDSVANFAGFSGPVAVLLAGADRIVPPEHGRRLHAALRRPVLLKEFAAAGHNDWPAGSAEPWWAEVLAAVLPR